MNFVKDYLIEAHRFLVKNKVFFIWYVILYAALNFSTAFNTFTKSSFDPYGLVSLAGCLILYCFIAYNFLLPLLLYKNINNEVVDKKSIRAVLFKNTGRVLKVTAVSFGVFGLVTGILFVIFDSLLHISLVKDAFVDTSTNPGFGFYPAKAAFFAFIESFFLSFYFFPLFYFFERKSLWLSLKQSFISLRRHGVFILPIIAGWAVYYFTSTLFIADGNYYLLAVRTLVESYLAVLTTIAVVLFYKDHYKIKLQTKSDVKKIIKEPNRFARWSMAVLAIIVIEMGIFLGYGVIVSLPEDIYHMQQYSGFLLIAYIVIATATPLVGGIFRLQKRSLNTLVFLLIGAIAFLGSTIVASAVFIPAATPNIPEVKQQFSGDELFDAINEKRKEYGIAKLEKNYWACEVANTELDANVALGKGSFTPNEGYWRAIEEAQEKYKLTSSTADPMPHFLMEFVTYGRTLEDTMYSWKNDGSKLLFVDKSYQYGCAVTKDGYGVVVTAEEFRNEPSPDINI